MTPFLSAQQGQWLGVSQEGALLLAFEDRWLGPQHSTPQLSLRQSKKDYSGWNSAEYPDAPQRREIAVSMSRKGNGWDNAVAESFFATIKKEPVYARDWVGRQQFRSAVFEYIEICHNRTRLHLYLG